MRWLSVVCVLAGCVHAQQDAARGHPAGLLLDVRKKVLLTVERLPKYLCTQTIDRSTFQPSGAHPVRSCDDLASWKKQTAWKLRPDTFDRLRLDVAVSGSNEMYSWVGEDRFEDLTLAELVGGGATLTGTFSGFLASIFGTNSASFTYNGETAFSGRTVVEFGFRVPVDKSTFSIGDKLHHAAVAYEGAFLVDPKTFDLLRLTVRASQIPEEVDVCESITTIRYGRMQLSNSEFLLPVEVGDRFTRADGSESENHTVFSACHEFLGESTLRFDAPPETGPAADQSKEISPWTLPPGLRFTVALTQPIKTAIAAAGDPIRAKLTGAIRDRNREVLVPKGAAVTGRIVQMERRYRGEPQLLTIAIKLETVEVSGVPQPFQAKLESSVENRPKPGRPVESREALGSFDQVNAPNVGFLLFVHANEDYVIHSGFEIDGTTTRK